MHAPGTPLYFCTCDRENGGPYFDIRSFAECCSDGVTVCSNEVSSSAGPLQNNYVTAAIFTALLGAETMAVLWIADQFLPGSNDKEVK